MKGKFYLAYHILHPDRYLVDFFKAHENEMRAIMTVRHQSNLRIRFVVVIRREQFVSSEPDSDLQALIQNDLSL